MGTATDRLTDDNAAYFSDMAQRYQSLALAEQHQAQSDLFATIAADYRELAAEAAAASGRATVTMARPARPDSSARWTHWVGRWHRPAASLTTALPTPLPIVPTGTK